MSFPVASHAASSQLSSSTIAIGTMVLAGILLMMLMFGRSKIGNFKARSLMTDNELEMYFRMSRALPECLIFPQVSLQALLEAGSSDPRRAEADRLRIAQQRVDYVICDPAGTVTVVVELDDKTHDRKKDALRDRRLAQAGIRTIRYQSKAKPSQAAIRKDVLGDPK
jgi:hypothetical protein